MVTVVVEDGTGLATANSYISNADADTYFGSHLYATDWTGASEANQDIALTHATRLIDDYFSFEGSKVSDTQALEFPRFNIFDRSGYLIVSTTLPTGLVNATAELAKWMLASDRNADASGKGFMVIRAGSLEMQPDTADKPSVLPDVVKKMLAPFGKPFGGAIVQIAR